MKSDIPVANIVTKSYLGVDHKFILLRKRRTKRVEIRAPLKKSRDCWDFNEDFRSHSMIKLKRRGLERENHCLLLVYTEFRVYYSLPLNFL